MFQYPQRSQLVPVARFSDLLHFKMGLARMSGLKGPGPIISTLFQQYLNSILHSGVIIHSCMESIFQFSIRVLLLTSFRSLNMMKFGFETGLPVLPGQWPEEANNGHTVSQYLHRRYSIIVNGYISYSISNIIQMDNRFQTCVRRKQKNPVYHACGVIPFVLRICLCIIGLYPGTGRQQRPGPGHQSQLRSILAVANHLADCLFQTGKKRPVSNHACDIDHHLFYPVHFIFIAHIFQIFIKQCSGKPAFPAIEFESLPFIQK